jgi:hypothetical protein
MKSHFVIATKHSAYTLMHDARFSASTPSTAKSTLALECKAYKEQDFYYINYYGDIEECGIKFTFYQLKGFYNTLIDLKHYSNTLYFKNSTKLSYEAMQRKDASSTQGQR